MSENEKTVSRRQAAEEAAAKKKKKYFWIKIGVILCVIIGIVLSVYESNFFYRKVKAIDVDGTQYSVAEYNWLYTQNFYEVYTNIYNSYGSMAPYIIDTTKPLSQQNYSQDQTWADYLKEYTEETFASMTALYDAGKEAGYVLEQEYYDRIDAEWNSLKEAAKAAGTTAGNYVVSGYGRGVNESVFREMYERYFYAYTYATSVAQAEEITSADIDTYYNENKDNFDTVSYRYYFVSSATDAATGTDTDTETTGTDTNATGTDTDVAASPSKQKAEAVLAAEDMDAYLAETEETMSTARYSLKANVNTAFADWLFDEARVAGDKDIFETSTGYYVIEFTEKNDLHYNMVNVRHILVNPEDTESEESWQAALAEAEGYVTEWKANGETEDAFADLAVEHSDDAGSAANGGLYSGIYKGRTVTEFENWSFDPARKEGDSEIIRTSYGYHIMYFVGEGEDYYTTIVSQSIENEKYTEFVAATREGTVVTDLSAMKYTAKHL